jgi:hypothetical protein
VAFGAMVGALFMPHGVCWLACGIFSPSARYIDVSSVKCNVALDGDTVLARPIDPVTLAFIAVPNSAPFICLHIELHG